jgi:hypothetical protein
MKPCSQRNYFCSGLDRVGPLGAEIEITHFLETDENKIIKNNTFKSCAEATELVSKSGQNRLLSAIIHPAIPADILLRDL